MSNADVMARLASAVEQVIIGAVAQFAEDMVELNNSGGDAPPAPKWTGNLRGSVRVTVGSPNHEEGIARPRRGVNYPLTTRKEARQAIQLGGFRVGDTLWFRWTAPYGNIVNQRQPWVEQDATVAMARLQNYRYDGSEHA